MVLLCCSYRLRYIPTFRPALWFSCGIIYLCVQKEYIVKFTKTVLLCIALISLFSCAASSRARLLSEIASSPEKNLRSYAFDNASTIISRVKPAPDFVVNIWRATDNITNYSSYMPTQEEMQMIDAYIALLPRRHREVLQKRLVAIYFINNLLGSGVTDYVLDDKNEIYAIMLFNPKTLKTDLSRWLTYRENTCFIRNAPEVIIEVNCGAKFTGFLYALTHEATHVVDYVESYTPYIETNIKIIKEVKTTSTAFTGNVWKDPATPLSQNDFENRRDVTFYGFHGPKIKITGADQIYEHLMTTPFVSLYGSMNWAEDFADFVTFYHLTQVLRQPYEIQYRKSDLIKVFRPMEGEKVRERFFIMQDFY